MQFMYICISTCDLFPYLKDYVNHVALHITYVLCMQETLGVISAITDTVFVSDTDTLRGIKCI